MLPEDSTDTRPNPALACKDYVTDANVPGRPGQMAAKLDSPPNRDPPSWREGGAHCGLSSFAVMPCGHRPLPVYPGVKIRTTSSSAVSVTSSSSPDTASLTTTIYR